MVVALWFLTGFVFIATLLAAFAIPSWPVGVLFLLSLLATLLGRFKLSVVFLRLVFLAGLATIGYDVYRLIAVLL